MAAVTSPVYSQEAYLRLGREISDSIKREAVCSHDIIDQTMLSTENRADELYIKFGEKYLQYLAYCIRLEDARLACKAASLEVLGAVGRTSSDLSVAKFGVGECGEITSRGMVECAKRTIPARVVFCSEEKGTNLQSHAFVIFDPDKEQIAVGRNPLEALARSTKGILVDPFFNLVRSVDRIEGTPFEVYLRKSGIVKIHLAEDVQQYPADKIKNLETNADKIHRVALALMKSPKWVPPESNLIKETILRNIRKEQLKKLTPQIAWKESKDSTLWFRTSKEEADTLCNVINLMFNLDIKTNQEKGKTNNFVVVIDRAAFISMRLDEL